MTTACGFLERHSTHRRRGTVEALLVVVACWRPVTVTLTLVESWTRSWEPWLPQPHSPRCHHEALAAALHHHRLQHRWPQRKGCLLGWTPRQGPW